ncbi:DNA cytosine methyltransferase [Streptomyces sp. NPDC048442]|uniref:DNA cytosine methyltransferase n=1 Tax=Streptomyces sp. NPDC048442 TaxID=3154823 RepID=UPI00342A3DAA
MARRRGSGPMTRIGSFCTGYGGLDMAVQAMFGGTTAWVTDPDPGAARILAHRVPDAPNLGDLTAVDWSQVEPVDIVCGGYPCQPFSLAGHLKGTSDERHIWPDIARALGVLRPRVAVFENVANHLRVGFDVVLADLARLGFDAEWCLVRASEVGAAHQRSRLFVLAWAADTGRPGLAGRWAEGSTADGRQLVADPVHLGGDRGGARRAGRDEFAARRVSAADAAGVGEREPADEALALAGGGQARVVPGGRGVFAPDGARSGRPAWGSYGPAIARWGRVLGRPAPSPTNDLGRLNPPFVEWLMGLPAGHVTDVPGLSRTAQLKALGNGVVPQQAEAAIRLLVDRAAA